MGKGNGMRVRFAAVYRWFKACEASGVDALVGACGGDTATAGKVVSGRHRHQ